MRLKQWWIESKRAGLIKKKIYQIVQRYYGFGTWHAIPINEKPYNLETVRMLNKLIDKNKFNKHMPFVEVGCGVGEIIGNLKWKYEKEDMTYPKKY